MKPVTEPTPAGLPEAKPIASTAAEVPKDGVPRPKRASKRISESDTGSGSSDDDGFHTCTSDSRPTSPVRNTLRRTDVTALQANSVVPRLELCGDLHRRRNREHGRQHERSWDRGRADRTRRNAIASLLRRDARRASSTATEDDGSETQLQPDFLRKARKAVLLKKVTTARRRGSVHYCSGCGGVSPSPVGYVAINIGFVAVLLLEVVLLQAWVHGVGRVYWCR
ncbi:hypothetical protein PLIIFM63780_008841 [Purpureocillium lilacinum]|nr:hypothetical protein PLIIFM63780_008841 [Purpureocillium lilacinum]